ncbi:MAG: hypothetical protein C5B43_03260 [Verrucomicrobia bacterium]|nr:MAG: hypothetical protein C5B43_03260 [Verrucomicrobiota bacterium]
MQKKLYILLLISTVSFGVFGCKREPEKLSMEDAIPVIAAFPIVKDIVVNLESIGVLQPAVFMEVKAQVSGTLLDVLVKEGQTVEKGSALFKIDSSAYEIKVKEAEAELMVEQSNLKAVQKKLNRFKELAERNLIARAEWEDLESAVEKAEAVIKLNETRLDAAKMDLEDCVVMANMDGKIGKIDLHPGCYISKEQSKALANISKTDSLIVEFEVTEKEFLSIPKESKRMEVEALCSSELCQEGSITFLDNQFNDKTGQLFIRGRIDNLEDRFRAGQSVKVRIPIGLEKESMVIPQKAIRYNEQGAYVYVVREDMGVMMRQILLGSEEGLGQIVKGGLDSGERIVVEGHERLRNGSKVEIMQ